MKEARIDQSLLDACRFQCQRHPAGRLIELETATPTLFYVKSGRVLASVVDPSGREVLSMLRGDGALFGVEMLRGVRLPYQLWTVTDVELCVGSAEAVEIWLAEQPAARALLDKLIDATTRNIVERMRLSGSAPSRLARYLLSASAGSATSAEAVPIDLPRNILARVLGMRPETLSRALRRLERAGAIALDPALRIVDRGALVLHADES